MKKLFYFAVGLLSLTVMFVGCQSSAEHSWEFETTRVDTVVHLMSGDTTSPACSIKLNLEQLKPLNEKDSIATRINRTVLSRLTEEEVSVLGIAGNIIQEYREELLPIYKGKTNETSIALFATFNYQYNYLSKLAYGLDGVLNATLVRDVYTGGAHGYLLTQLLNFDVKTGRLLKKEDVFVVNADKAIGALIKEDLIKQAQEKKDDFLLGLMKNSEFFLPDNFLLQSDKVRFHYNAYEKAPYAWGDFDVEIPYEQLKDYMLLRKR